MKTMVNSQKNNSNRLKVIKCMILTRGIPIIFHRIFQMTHLIKNKNRLFQKLKKDYRSE